MTREKYARQSLGAAHRLIKESKVLLVGAGGIGCELLKNLVLTGFGEVHIIDLDTIDLSNLNRQFLFRQEHIKKPKALVAKDVAQKFNPNVKLMSHHANIKDASFDLDWFSSFALVFNALDNLEARRHVNKMCLAADVPLIESGTTGFNGQVQVIKKGITACYDCTPKTTPKSFPVCTIRSTPSQPIHCVVWAKSYLLPELFGVSEEETTELDNTQDADNAEEIEKLKQEAQALKKIRGSMGSEDFAQQIFDKVFLEDIERLAKMEDMWKMRKPPEPLSYKTLDEAPKVVDKSISETDQRVWSSNENFIVFKDSLSRLANRIQTTKKSAQSNSAPPTITFDKDDVDTLDFVTATSNLRSIIFGIELKSKFEIKQMAGNIIPAIATTNAMIAGLCVLESFKVLRGDWDKTKMIFLDRGNMTAGSSEKPNSECAVCSMAMGRIQVNVEKALLKDLVQDVLKDKLGYGEEMTIMNEKGIVYDPDLEDNLEKKFDELNLTSGSVLIIKDDEDEHPKIDLQLMVEIKSGSNDAKPVVLVEKDDEKFEVPSKPEKEQTGKEDDHLTNGNAPQPILTNGTATSTNIAKRKRELDEDEATGGSEGAPAKKLQHTSSSSIAGGETNNNDSTIVLDDADDGAIVLDDDD